MNRQGGFTLVEVLVAVVVLGLVMATLGHTIGATSRAYIFVDEQHTGYLVASDKLVEMQVYQQWPNTGRSDSEIIRNGRHWWIRTLVSKGPYPDTRRVDIEVGLIQDEEEEQEQLAYHLTSLIGKPVTQ